MKTTLSPPAKSKSAIVFIFVTVVLDMIGFGIILPVLPQLIETVGQMSLAEAAKMSAWMFAAYAVATFAAGPLMGNLSRYWSRRIDETHRLVYTVDDADLDVIACRGHYDD